MHTKTHMQAGAHTVGDCDGFVYLEDSLSERGSKTIYG